MAERYRVLQRDASPEVKILSKVHALGKEPCFEQHLFGAPAAEEKTGGFPIDAARK